MIFINVAGLCFNQSNIPARPQSRLNILKIHTLMPHPPFCQPEIRQLVLGCERTHARLTCQSGRRIAVAPDISMGHSEEAVAQIGFYSCGKGMALAAAGNLRTDHGQYQQCRPRL
jgi:hypothetical protein